MRRYTRIACVICPDEVRVPVCPAFPRSMISTLKAVMVTVGLAAWLCVSSSPASANEANCGSNRDAICVSEMVPEVDAARVWSLLDGSLEYSLYFFACLGGDRVSCSLVGNEIAADNGLPFDIEAAAALLGPSCDIGHEMTCAAVGYYLKETAPKETDPELIAQLFHRACRSDADLCEFEAALYIDEILFTQDFAKAAEIHHYACERQSRYSCYHLGSMHVTGTAPDSSEKMGLELFDKSCGYGWADGCFETGMMHYNDASKDRNIALDYLRQACEMGRADGCYNAGLIIGLESDPYPPDYDGELALQIKACDLEQADGCGRAADLYASSSVANSDEKLAFDYAQRGCDLGSGAACASIALFYSNGTGIDKDPAKSLEVYQHACNLKDGWACNEAATLFASGAAGVQDDFRAAELYGRACELGEAFGCANAAYFAENQRGVFRLDSEILRLYKTSCDGGYDYACHRVRQLEAN